jgi:UDPglucose--hexose-1-phosphate uridylyltransferase
MPFNFAEQPHRRFNPLTREWVLVSPHRTQRPWQGQVEPVQAETNVSYDPKCYMCPGNTRASGAKNPNYKGALVFDNDFPALRPDAPETDATDGLLVARGESGICRVVCFSPRHDLTLARMEAAAIREIVDVWAAQYAELGALANIRHVQIFENRGAMMGASNPHPHCQIWATSSLPNEPAKELENFGEYQRAKGSCLLCDYMAQELKARERLVEQNDHFAAVVPFWAVWPFETLVISKRHAGSLVELSREERDALAELLKKLTTRYNNLFNAPFPYSMGFHQSPTDKTPHPEWHLHAHFYPPLLRSATVRKFMVGFELLGSPQRDLTAEQAAERLRGVPNR